MNNAIFSFREPANEPVLNYAPGSKERALLEEEVKRQENTTIEIPLIIGGKEVKTGNTGKITMPHKHAHVLATYHKAGEKEINMAIEAAMAAKTQWADMSWVSRASIMLKAAELLSKKYRYLLNAATMLGQSKNVYQAEIDSACEAIDFLRFSAHYMSVIYNQQPASDSTCINRLEYRPLEGFVYAITPFNFTAIAVNLNIAPAIMGNVTVWKPATTAILSNYYMMKVLQEAGLPDGVINFIPGSGELISKIVLGHKDFAGIHFTGSTSTFNSLWKTIGNNLEGYKTYPKIVGETGGKDFIVAHQSANALQLATAIVRGAFEYQGQKCSAASRAYVPKSLWNDTKKHILSMLSEIKMGEVNNLKNYINAVIDEKAFDSIMKYVDMTKTAADAEIVAGGNGDKSKGYYIEPTVITTSNPNFATMETELFGPVITIYLYEDSDFEKTLHLCDNTSPYALTGSIFAQDRYAVETAFAILRNAAGNFYINDKPTGAVVGQQPFGGARASGTNDKAGSMLNLLRWVSPRTIKETLVTPENYSYPFLA